ncbi:MAG: trehalose-phosphatase [Nocardioidaceae bacterium]
MAIDPQTPAGRAGLDALLADPLHALAAFDYDGTLAPIVADPSRAVPHPGVLSALVGLAEHVDQVAIVTGRPARVAVELAGFSVVDGLDRLVVIGQYGLERWDKATGEFASTRPPSGLGRARAELPGLLDTLRLGQAVIEDKGLSVAVHVRRMPRPQTAYDDMVGPLTQLATRNGLTTEPGRMVVELRPTGTDKGRALRALADERGARTVMFTGDDLGDLAAFAEVERLREQGGAGLLVCSGSTEVTALAERADIVVDGPPGVATLLRALVDAFRERQ